MAQMFHDTMGTRVLNLSSSTRAEGLRSYAHCVDGASSGGDGTTTSTTTSTQAATLLLINVSPTVTFQANLPVGVHAPPPTGACTINRPCAQQYIGKSQSCMVMSGRLIVHAPVQHWLLSDVHLGRRPSHPDAGERHRE